MASDKIDETWREDSQFKEMSCYSVTDAIGDPWSSGYNLIGAGGILDDDEPVEEGEDEDRAVIFNLQRLDDGEEMEVRVTPEGARLLAKRLLAWADEADKSDMTIDEVIEGLREDFYEDKAARRSRR